jgi:hypothetical protein
MLELLQTRWICFHLKARCSSPDLPTVPCDAHYTEQDGGLWLPWLGNIFVNPPYDDVPRWLAKTNDEFNSGRAELVVCLVPYRPETNAWKVLVRSDAAIFVLEDRLRFGGRSYVSPSVSAVVVWGGSPEALAGLGATLPRHHRVVRTQIKNQHRDGPILAPNRVLTTVGNP